MGKVRGLMLSMRDELMGHKWICRGTSNNGARLVDGCHDGETADQPKPTIVHGCFVLSVMGLYHVRVGPIEHRPYNHLMERETI